MAHSNSTTNYALPQFVGSDKPAWLTDVNTAMSAIDTQMKANANAAAAADTKATTADTKATNAATAAGNAATAAANAQNTANSQAGAITSLGNRVTSLESSVSGLSNARHVTGVTTSGNWRITRYSDGYIRGTFTGVVTFASAGTSYNGWYRSVQNVTLPFTVHTSDAAVYGLGAVSGRLFAAVGMAAGNSVECQLLSGASFAGGVSVSNATIVVEGREN